MMEFLGLRNRKVRCSECKVSVCVVCRGPAHGGDRDLGELEGLMKRFGIRRCPNCGHATIEDGGCSHMQCKACGSHYTWQEDGGTVSM